MSNTSNGPGEKGSKKWMQFVANDKDCKKQLNRAMSGKQELIWISPRADENYAEYKLNQEKMLEWLDIIDKDVANEVFSFWPKQQSQWDGIAVTKDWKDYYLIEAKAHLSEVDTPRKFLVPGSSQGKLANDELILKSMKEAYDALADGGDFENWKSKYYQLANRMTFMYFLNKSPLLKDKRFHIVLLNFVNDLDYKPTSKAAWEEHYKDIWADMIGKASIPEYVQLIYWDLKE